MNVLKDYPINEELIQLLSHAPFLEHIDDRASVATKVAEELVFREYEKNECLITQGEMGGDTFFLLSGPATISVNGHKVATRVLGDTVGEMGAINPLQPRSATVTASMSIEVGVLSASGLANIADEHQGIWRNLAEIVSQRLLQRGDMHREPNPFPRIFIGSSSEGLVIAEQLKSELINSLDTACDINCWNKDIFKLSNSTIETLERESAECDFAILVAGPDDLLESRNSTFLVPRDNVIFEAGLFMGALSRSRTFILKPSSESADQTKLPSDLLGITLASFTKKEERYDLSVAVGKISDLVKKRGVKTRFRDFPSSN